MDRSYDFYSGIRDSQTVPVTREQVFDTLEKMGVERAVVEFSGGHDEGGADHIGLFREDEQDEFRKLSEHIWPYVRDEDGKLVYEELRDEDGQIRLRSNGEPVTRPKTRELTKDEEAEMILAQALAAPVYDKFYSFAGEFYVTGTVEWSVSERSVIMDGDERIERSHGIYEEF